jgi:hypothetical protein
VAETVAGYLVIKLYHTTIVHFFGIDIGIVFTFTVFFNIVIYYYSLLHVSTNRNVAGSIPDGVIGINSLA